MINKQDCKYGDNCTFAYHQEEIDVWTEERKGTLNRDLLFDPLGGVKRGSLTIAKLLKEHQGIFTFLCEVPAARPAPCTAAVDGTDREGAPWHTPSVGGCQPWDPGAPNARIGRSWDCQKVRLRGCRLAKAPTLSSPSLCGAETEAQRPGVSPALGMTW